MGSAATAYTRVSALGPLTPDVCPDIGRGSPDKTRTKFIFLTRYVLIDFHDVHDVNSRRAYGCRSECAHTEYRTKIRKTIENSLKFVGVYRNLPTLTKTSCRGN